MRIRLTLQDLHSATVQPPSWIPGRDTTAFLVESLMSGQELIVRVLPLGPGAQRPLSVSHCFSPPVYAGECAPFHLLIFKLICKCTKIQGW
jgi:hypothetical protein